MAKLLPACFVSLLIAQSLSLLACGGTGTQPRLVSVAVTPQTADAANFSNGMVSFTATGTYDRAPSPQVINPAT